MASIIRDYDLNVYVPEDPGSLGSCDALIADSTGLDVLRHTLRNGNLPNYYVVSDEFTLYRSILRVLDVDRVEVMQVGIDVGRQLAYVILCDSVLLKAGYSRSLKELISFIKDLEACLRPTKVIVKVGGHSALPEFYSTYLKSIPPRYELYIVDEMNSSTRSQVGVYGLRIRFTRDIYAALNIVLREGIRVHVT